MAEAPVSPPTASPLVKHDRSREVVRIGVRRVVLTDLYHALLNARWRNVLGLIVLVYIAVNTFFAFAYMACGGVENARPGHFGDAFFFSVQTLATIGYGKMTPHSIAANVLVSAEALLGLVGAAMATGLMFAKFSRPTARVMFSRVAVVSLRDGTPSLMFRMANQRGNQIVEANLHVVFAIDEHTLEGEAVRRFYDLALSRDRTALFTLTWTGVHPITATSPLASPNIGALRRQRASIVVSVMGHDETFSQTVHARHTYDVDDIVWNARFEDVLLELPSGRRAVDYTRFHKVVRLPDDAPAIVVAGE